MIDHPLLRSAMLPEPIESLHDRHARARKILERYHEEHGRHLDRVHDEAAKLPEHARQAYIHDLTRDKGDGRGHTARITRQRRHVAELYARIEAHTNGVATEETA